MFPATGPPTLQDLCLKAVLRLITPPHVLDILAFAQAAHIPATGRLQEACLSFVSRTFEAVCQASGPQRVETAIGSDRFAALLAESHAAELARRRRAHEGRILERAAPPALGCEVEGGTQVLRCGRAVAAHPYESLRRGVAWPPGVDPAHRERHLSDADFERVLGMLPAQFYALPAWRREQLKRGAGLF